MAKTQKKSAKTQERFPWVLLVVVVATIYLFWILPIQFGSRTVDVQFPQAK